MARYLMLSPINTHPAGTIVVDSEENAQPDDLIYPELALNPVQVMAALDNEASALLQQAGLPGRIVRLWENKKAIEAGLNSIFSELKGWITRQSTSYPKDWREKMRGENNLIADLVDYPELYRLVEPGSMEKFKLILACLGTLKILKQDEVCRLWRGLRGR